MSDDLDEALARARRAEEAKREALRRQRLPAEAIAERLERAAAKKPGALLLAQGSYSPYPSIAERLLVLRLGGRSPRQILDAWIDPTAIPPLATALGERIETLLGGCDAMYSTAWSVAWGASAAGRFSVWSKRGHVLTRWSDGRLEIGSDRDGAEKGPSEELRAVVGELSNGWVHREVALELTDGRRLVLAAQDDPLVGWDPTYDGLNLAADADWVVQLCRAVSANLGIPAVLHPDLS